MASVVIFGGTGFIGRHIASTLVRKEGAEVVLADFREPRYPLPNGVRFERRDVRLPIAPIEGIVPDLIVNLAAVHRTPGHPDHEYLETNEYGALHVNAYARENEVNRMWFTSSIAVYGPNEEPKTERSQLAPTSAYGRSKVRAEERHKEWVAEKEGRHLLIVRPATVFGPGEGGNFTRLAKSLRNRTFVFPGRRGARKACGYVDDLVGSLRFMDRLADPVMTYNFAYPQPPTSEEIVEAFVGVGGFRPPRGTIPAPLLLGVAKALHGVGISTFSPERVAKLMHSTNIIPEVLLRHEYPYQTDLPAALERWFAAPPAGRFE